MRGNSKSTTVKSIDLSAGNENFLIFLYEYCGRIASINSKSKLKLIPYKSKYITVIKNQLEISIASIKANYSVQRLTLTL